MTSIHSASSNQPHLPREFLRALALFFLLILLLLASTHPVFADEWQELSPEARALFPTATRQKAKLSEVPAIPVYQLNELLGYVFETDDMTHFPGFSGETINLRIGLDTQGVIRGITLVRHHEPIFLHGLGEEPLQEFITQYLNQSLHKRIIIDTKAHQNADPNTLLFDGVTKATVSIMVINDTILASALNVARHTLSGFAPSSGAQLNLEPYQALNYEQMQQQGLLYRWQVPLASFAEQLQISPEDVTAQWQEENPDLSQAPTFDVIFAVLSPALVGKNLLGEEEYARLLREMGSQDIALLLGNFGDYSPLSPQFVAGTSPVRFSLSQQGSPIALRDTDFYSVQPEQLAQGPVTLSPNDRQWLKVLRIKSSSGFDPSQPLTLSVRFPTRAGFMQTEYRYLSANYSLPASLWQASAPPQVAIPLWQKLWQQRSLDIALIVGYLCVISALFILQHRWLVQQQYFAQWRAVALLYVYGVIGIYTQGQLSVVNIYTLLLALKNGFDITLFLLDPIIFILWSFTFVSLFLWGRGVFCGWLCPFGALQEMVAWLAKQFSIRQWRIPKPWHRVGISLKYFILLALVGLSFVSLTTAERLSELEPFKTAVTLLFQREWAFVAYALILLLLASKIHKVYCRYLCPLGAGLAILGRLRLFSWLDRKKECGTPCQLCAKSCGVNAIREDGQIDYNECVQCLECSVIYHDPQRCVVQRYGKKRRPPPQNDIPVQTLTP